jgi:hypothetical protein
MSSLSAICRFSLLLFSSLLFSYLIFSSLPFSALLLFSSLLSHLSLSILSAISLSLALNISLLSSVCFSLSIYFCYASTTAPSRLHHSMLTTSRYIGDRLPCKLLITTPSHILFLICKGVAPWCINTSSTNSKGEHPDIAHASIPSSSRRVLYLVYALYTGYTF